jgi:electron-transferring-flavoprotein dehydrogenase
LSENEPTGAPFPHQVFKAVTEARASDYPPPFSSSEVVAAPTDAPDERIDVGVLIVGGGPAGLACAIRLGQLLEDDPATAERLGEVPVALVDKGKQPGSHLLSGAVMNPRAVRRLFRDRPDQLEGLPTYGEVHGEGVYLLTRKRALRIPPPPTLRNHGNWVVSISQMCRYLSELAEGGGTFVLPETSADRLLVDHGRVVGIRSGDKGRGKEGEPLGNFEPGSDIVAQVTVLAEGTAGHLTGAALDHFGLNGPEPQIWELGVKEVWRVPKPLTRIVHTMGWPLRKPAKYREFGGSWLYPMGDDMVSLGFVAGLDYRDVELSVHDLLQEFKTHPFVRKMLDGGERVAWGAKTITSGGWHALPSSLGAPGLLLAGESAGLVDLARLKGVHYAIESGRLAAEAAYRSLQRGESPGRIGAFDEYDSEVRNGYLGKSLREVRNMRQAFEKGFFVGGGLASAMTVSKGKFPPGELHNHPDAEAPLLRSGRAAHYPAPDGVLTFDKLSSVFASGNRTRDDQPNHVRIERNVPRDVAEMWAWMCPAQVYEVGDDHGDGTVEVRLTPSNCVQCGAITARGGRLTPPEGGSGPEYTLT